MQHHGNLDSPITSLLPDPSPTHAARIQMLLFSPRDLSNQSSSMASLPSTRTLPSYVAWSVTRDCVIVDLRVMERQLISKPVDRGFLDCCR